MEINQTIANEFAAHFEKIKIELADENNDKLAEILQSLNETSKADLIKRGESVVLLNSYPTRSSYKKYFEELLNDFTSEVEQNMKEYAEKYKVLVYLKKLKYQFKKYLDNYEPMTYGAAIPFEGIRHKYIVSMNKQLQNDYENCRFQDIFYFLDEICTIQKEYLNIILEYFEFLTEIIVLVPENTLIDMKIIENTKPFIVYTGEFSKTTSKNIEPIEVLDKYQIGLLFHYLMQAGIFLNYPPKEIAKYASILTGFAPKQLYEEACSPIQRVKKDMKCNKYEGIEPPINLNRLKQELLNVIELIDKDIVENKPKKSKKEIK